MAEPISIAAAPAWQSLADSAPIMMWMSDPDGGCTWFNRPWLAFVGRPLADAQGMGWTESIHPADVEGRLAAYREALAGGTPLSFEYRLRRHDGEYRCILDHGKPYRSEDGSLQGYIGSSVDVTEHRQAETALRSSEARFRLLSDGAPVMLWLSDADGHCVHLNRRMREFWGVGNEDLPGFDWSKTIHLDDAGHVGAIVAGALLARRPFTVEARYRNLAGEYRILRTDAEPHIDPPGHFAGFIGVNIDITEQHAAMSALARSEERFSRFMAHLPGLAWIKDGAGRYIFANAAAATAFGRPADHVLGRTDAELFPPDLAAQFARNDARARAEPGGLRVIETLTQPDGIEHHSIVSKFVIPDSEGGPGLVAGVAIDVTDQQAAEQQIQALHADVRQRLEERDILLAALPVGVFIAHDAACSTITMNAAGAAMLRLPLAANASKTGPDAGALPFRVLKDGKEVPAADLPMQRAARLATPVYDEELDVAFSDGSSIALHEWACPLFDGEGRVRGCVGVFVDISERKRAERQKLLLIDELNHRAKNTLAIVQSIATQTLRQSPDPKAFVAAFMQRIEALARAHAMLADTGWQGAPLDQLVATALSPFRTAEGQVDISGPPLTINAAFAVTFALVLHELATNAVKHGALSGSSGRIWISWSAAGGTIAFIWREASDRSLSPPGHTGFGSRLINASASQLGGSATLDYLASGLTATLTFPADAAR